MALKPLKEIPEWWELCARYRYDIYAFAVEALGVNPTWQQELLFQSIAFDGSRTSVASGHGTGKTASSGIVALWHLLFFEESIMLFTAPQIGQLKKQVWKEISINLDRLRQGPLGWLADYVGYQSELVYIKGYKEKWYVFAKTAPKHQPTNIAGMHGDNYTVWIDEACGVDDAVMDVVLGALTHEDNRAVMTSQPAKSSGMFYDTHHKLSHRVGGDWVSLVFNGEESPIVSKKSIREQLLKYGSRDDPQYQIRVLGRFPDRLDEFLVTMRQAEESYVGSCIFDEHQFGYVITVDVGGGVGRDDSVIAVSKVWGEAQWGERARRVEVIDIPLCKNKDNIDELFGVINECVNYYPNALLVVDDNGAGKGLGQKLKNNGIFYLPVYWGGACFNNENRKSYVNKRAQAYVCLAKAIQQGRFKMKTKKYAVKFKEQIIHIPYCFDEHSRYKIKSKEEMKREGIKSPDLGDAFAFLFLENVHYTEAYEKVDEFDDSAEGQEQSEKATRFAKLREQAKNM